MLKNILVQFLLLARLFDIICAIEVTRSKDYSYWKLITEINVGGVLPVQKYKSSLTGLTLVLARAESPIVNGYFCLGTQAFDNDGLPHTLEHLIFLGSEDYPYKEVLDLLANRCLSDRTNAWTSVDHTCYTIYTAGSGGFLNILPVYVDHILFPLLRKEDFLTEVHHISGQGLDAGVVYSEMQGVENEVSTITNMAMLDNLYPGNNSYIFQTGGMLKNLREKTNIEAVREYHKKFYRSENLHLTVTGPIEPEELFAALNRIETKILEKNLTKVPFERPFQEPLEPLLEDVTVKIDFPSKEAEFGSVSMGWRIPGKVSENQEDIKALRVLTGYLSSSPISPLESRFVEIDDPLSTGVSVDVNIYSEASFTLDFENVPVEKMETIEPKFKEVLQEILDKGPDFFDLHIINTIIERSLLSHKLNLENSPHLVVPDPAVFDMIYGEEPEHFQAFLEEEAMAKLINKSSEFWLDLLNVTFSRPKVVVLSYPNEKLDSDIGEMEVERLTKQINELGEDGLKQSDNKINNALKSQQLPPDEVLKAVPLADVNSIKFRKLTPHKPSNPKQPSGFNLRTIPFPFHLDDVRSQFIRANLFFDTSKLLERDHPYLTLLTELWLQCPVKHADTGIIETLDELTVKRSKQTLSITNSIGYDGSTFSPGGYSHLIHFYLEASIGKYLPAVEILKEALFEVEFTEDRIRTTILQLLNGIPGDKLSASTVVSALADNIFFDNRTNIYHSSFLRQQKFLNSTLELLRVNASCVITKLNKIRKLIVRQNNCLGFMSANLQMLKELYGKTAANVWREFFPANNKSHPGPPVKQFNVFSDCTYRNRSPSLRHAIIGLPGSDACHLKQIIPFDISNWESPDLASVRLMLQYMTDRFYDKIRGKGLTYGISIVASVGEGRIILSFTRASHINLAFKEFRSMIAEYTNIGGQTNNTLVMWDPILLDSARGSQIYNWAEREETTEGVTSLSLKSYLRGTKDPFYGRRFVQLLASVSIDSVRRVAQQYLPKFLDPRSTETSVVCGPGEVEKIKNQFSQFDLYLLKIDDLENSILTN